MKTTLLSAFVLSMFMIASCGDEPKHKESTEVANDQNEAKMPNNDREDDAEWLVKIADGNMGEIELGKLAEKNGKMKEVKEYGAMMVKHHTKLGEEAKAYAMSKNISLPATLSDDCKKNVEDFSNKAGHDFDKAYIDEMIDKHEKTISKFEKKAEDNDADAGLKTWVNNTLPLLRTHLADIKAIKEKFDAMKK